MIKDTLVTIDQKKVKEYDAKVAAELEARKKAEADAKVGPVVVGCTLVSVVPLILDIGTVLQYLNRKKSLQVFPAPRTNTLKESFGVILFLMPCTTRRLFPMKKNMEFLLESSFSSITTLSTLSLKTQAQTLLKLTLVRQPMYG
jgi:hypothetical protein